MKSIDAHKLVFYIGIAVVIEQAIGQGTLQLTHAIPTSWIPTVQAWAAILAFTGTAIMTAVSGVNGLAPGAQVPSVPPAVKPLVLFALLVGSLLLWASPSHAQPKAAAPSNDTAILQRLHDDAVAASADAASNNDGIAKACYDAIASLSEAKLQAQSVTGGGVLLAFQKVRDITKLNASPVGQQLIIGCAPLAQDAKLSFAQFLAQIGGAVLAKGFLIPLVP